MSTHTRAKTRRQRLHTGARSASHANDKTAGELRRKNTFICVGTPPVASPHRDFSGQLTSHEFTWSGTEWQRCNDPEEYGEAIDREANRRGFFYEITTRAGRPVRMKRKAATPVEILTVTFPPWLSAWCAAEFAAARDPRPQLALIRNLWAEQTRDRIERIRYVLGLSFHANTADPHFDLALSRQSGDGARRGEKAGLELVGPWATATDRQVRAGATISLKKQTQLARSIANFRHRYGPTAVPLDVAMARDLDTAAESVLGAELAPFMAAYAASVPALEAAHSAAARAVLESALAELDAKSVQTPTPTRAPARSAPGFGR